MAAVNFPLSKDVWNGELNALIQKPITEKTKILRS